MFTFFLGQLTLSPTSFTLVENASFQVNCTHPVGISVSLVGLTSLDITSIGIDPTMTLFTIPRVLRSDNNVQFTCKSLGLPLSAPANVTVYCKLTPLIEQCVLIFVSILIVYTCSY